ncbi:MAG: NAD-dependent epimerase/dehydratase family protein [Polyangiaceae bacterium]
MPVRETAAPAVRVLVTGSQGFVGKHVRAALARRGAVCVGVDRPGSGAEVEVDLAAQDFEPDGVWEHARGPVRSVISMAANITRTSSVDAMARSNLRLIAEAPVRLIEQGARSGACLHLVDCSTFKVFGPQREDSIVAATHPRRPDPFSYGSAKALGERLLAIAAPRAGFTYAVVHPTCVYGPGQHRGNAIPVFLESALRGEAPTVFGDGGSVRDDVYVGDLADLLVEVALRQSAGSYNAAGERSRTILEVAEACCVAAAEGASPSVRPRCLPEHAPKWWLDQVFDVEAARRVFGYEPTPLSEGLARETAWLRAGAPDETTVPLLQGDA